jgi:predicted DNA-binding transcriptional regulator AlpA
MKNRQRKPDSSAEALLGTIDDAQQILGAGRNLIYDMMNAKALEKVKLGGRTMITIASIRRVAKTGFQKSAA